jgi:hypothetical protein
VKFQLKLTERLEKSLHGYDFEVGVLSSQKHFEPLHTELGQKPQLGSYAGGAVRKKSNVPSELTTGQILVENSKRLGIDLLRAPFKSKNNQEINDFTKAFFKMALSDSNKQGAIRNAKRLINLVQAIIRNPILRGDYGNNKGSTADAKGFDRLLFDTGQMFKAIKARIRGR